MPDLAFPRRAGDGDDPRLLVVGASLTDVAVFLLDGETVVVRDVLGLSFVDVAAPVDVPLLDGTGR